MKLEIAEKALDEAVAHEKRCRQSLDAARVSLNATLLAYYEAKYGVVVGVRVCDHVNRRVGVVRAVETSTFKDKPWLMVALDKRDGSPGNAVVRFYNWELVT